MPRTTNTTPRLRAPKLADPFQVVLVEPEIPPNTGNIARLCAATGSRLCLVGKLGFRIDEHAVRRAGVDYWHLVDVRQEPDFSHFAEDFAARRTAWTPTSLRSRLTALVFGKESVGLSEELIARYPDRVVGIPTIGAVRSLNLANAVGIALFEALRQTGALAAPFTG